MARPGCVQGHRAFIFDRGGRKRIGPILDLSQVKWERDRDGVSEASIRLEADSCSRQAKMIDSLATHRHELVLYRGRQRVWEGPLHRIGSYVDHVEIVAKDVLAYLFAQPLTQDWDNRFHAGGVTTVTGRIEEIIKYELTHGRTQFYSANVDGAAEAVAEWRSLGGIATAVADGWEVQIPAFEGSSIPTLPPVNVVPYLDVRHFINEAQTSTKTVPYQMTVGEHLLGLAQQSGIDFTAVGRRIVIWDVSRYIGRLSQMTDSNFTSNVIVTEYGADHAQAAFVVDEEGGVGSALNLKNLGFYGPWSTIYTSYNVEGSEVPTQAELNSQAQRNLAGRSPAPLEVRVPDNSGILLNDDVTINDLVPGVQIPLLARLNARQVSQMQKIDHVKVTETPDGEDIQITLTPATKPDSDEPQEED